jgi:serine/threonine protein kinase
MGLADKKKKIFDGRYEVLSIVGRGSCSVVYQARHNTAPSSEVALKVLLDNKHNTSNSDRLRKEALALVSSRHKYIVRLDDFHSVGDLCYLSLEYAPEFDLRKFTAKKGGKLPPALAELFLRQAAEALDFIHHVGIIHRDIKPDNILVMSEKEIRLADFGVAILPGDEPSSSEAQAGVGTMNYMAPEVLEGDACGKSSDLYALGVSFYEMLAGTHPFEGAPLMQQLDVREPENFPHLADIVPEIPDYLAGIIMRAMAYEPEKRFPSARDLVQNLLRNRSYVAPGRYASSLNLKQSKDDTQGILQAVDNNDQLAKLEKNPGKTPVERRKKSVKLEQRTQAAEPIPEEIKMDPDSESESESDKKDENTPSDTEKQSTEEPRKPRPARDERRPALFANYKPTRNPGRKRVSQTDDLEDEESSGQGEDQEGKPERREAKSKESRSGEKREQPRPSRTSEGQMEISADSSEETEKASGPGGEISRKPTLIMNRESVNEITSKMGEKDSYRAEIAEGKKPRPSAQPEDFGRNMEALYGQAKEGQSARPTPAAPSKTPVAKIAKIAIAAAVVLIIGSRFMGGESVETAPVETGTVAILDQKDLSSAPIPAPQGGTLADEVSFPLLPAGLYSGGIEGLFPNRSLPLAMIAFADQKTLSVIIGMEGWTPAIIDLEPFFPEGDHAGSNTLRISSNGFVLDMTGQKVKNEIVGTFRNTITGEQGEWRIAPQN